MDKSDSISNLASALSKFQGEIRNPGNTATNPFFKSKYAPLNDVLNLVRPLLSKNGLSVVQAPSGDGENIVVTTTILHSSGEWIQFPPLILKADKATAQGAGSAITYARRYALSAVLGISSEDDDDGNHKEPTTNGSSSEPTTKGKGLSKKGDNKKSDKESIEGNSLASDKQLNFIYKLVEEKKYGPDAMKSYIQNAYDKDSSKALTKKEASEIIEMLQGLGQNQGE